MDGLEARALLLHDFFIGYRPAGNAGLLRRRFNKRFDLKIPELTITGTYPMRLTLAGPTFLNLSTLNAAGTLARVGT